MSDITIEPTGSHELERCECCHARSRTVSGCVYRAGAPDAMYFVHWTPGKVAELGANFDSILGRWGDGASREDRCAIALEFRMTERGPGFRVIDSAARPVARSELVGRALGRADVVGTEWARLAFELADAVWLHDERIREISGPT